MVIITAICAFIIAALSGMGVGSAGLLVVYLTLICDVPQLTAQGMNLAFFLIASASSLLYHLPRRKLPFLPIATLALAGMIAVFPGSFAATVLPEETVRRLFAVMLILSGCAGLLRRGEKNPSKSS